MEDRYKRYKKYISINLVSLVFLAISATSITLAWFAYSRISSVQTEIDIKSWKIDMSKKGVPVSNEVRISLADIYPGMETVSEVVNISNDGDADALIKYDIVSIRILDENNYVIDEKVTSPYVEDLLSHNYPFHVNMNLSRNYALAGIGSSAFEVSISWPLDSGNNDLDSDWGTKAYDFQDKEKKLFDSDKTYQVRPAIEIVIKVSAEQDLHQDDSSDYLYNLGDIIKYNAVDDVPCFDESANCLNTRVIDVNNLVKDNTITLLPDINSFNTTSSFGEYDTTFSSVTKDWKSKTRYLQIEDLLNVVSTDITSSYYLKNGTLGSVIGNVKYTGRITDVVNKAINSNGHYTFLKSGFSYLTSDNCVWTGSNYNESKGFALKSNPDTTVMLYGETNSLTCKIVPLIIIDKPR